MPTYQSGALESVEAERQALYWRLGSGWALETGPLLAQQTSWQRHKARACSSKIICRLGFVQIQAGPTRTRGSTPPCRLVEPLTQSSVTAVGELCSSSKSLVHGQDQAGGKRRSIGGEISEPKSAQRRFANVTVTVDCERGPEWMVTWMWAICCSALEGQLVQLGHGWKPTRQMDLENTSRLMAVNEQDNKY